MNKNRLRVFLPFSRPQIWLRPGVFWNVCNSHAPHLTVVIHKHTCTHTQKMKQSVDIKSFIRAKNTATHSLWTHLFHWRTKKKLRQQDDEISSGMAIVVKELLCCKAYTREKPRSYDPSTEETKERKIMDTIWMWYVYFVRCCEWIFVAFLYFFSLFILSHTITIAI